MRVLIIFLLIIIVIAVMANAKSLFGGLALHMGNLGKEEAATQQETNETISPESASIPASSETAQNSQESSQQPELKNSSPDTMLDTMLNTMLDTVITSGPENLSTISNPETTFTFWANGLAEKDRPFVSFETMVLGFDQSWVQTGVLRSIRFPSATKSYTILVRARLGNEVDPTPAQRTFTIKVFSPYYKKITIYNVTLPGSSLLFKARLYPYLEQGENINISGWTIKMRAGEIKIPQGIKNFRPIYNAIPNDNIVVEPGNQIFISSEQSPFGSNISFRPNSCFGYLAAYYGPSSSSTSYTLPLWYSSFISSSFLFASYCPSKPKVEQISFLSPVCQEFILKKIFSCDVTNYSQDSSVAGDRECVSYINNNFTYEGCYQNHVNDRDFIKNIWYVYLNTSFALPHPLHDTIELRDSQGFLVDQYIY